MDGEDGAVGLGMFRIAASSEAPRAHPESPNHKGAPPPPNLHAQDRDEPGDPAQAGRGPDGWGGKDEHPEGGEERAVQEGQDHANEAEPHQAPARGLALQRGSELHHARADGPAQGRAQPNWPLTQILR